ncbi:MAG: DUF6529 family protein [Acidimicrobiales bacterium]|nr:DUF6529 family protein [Acidimicrobiales bacterium]
MTTTATETNPTAIGPAPHAAALLVAAAIGGAVAISLGVYGSVHDGTGQTIWQFGFPTMLSMKAWFTTAAAVLALAQGTTALWMWSRLPGAGPAPAWASAAHRWLGTVAFLCTLPVAYHCLWALGFRTTDTRVVAHSILGCAFFGAFTTKMLVLHSRRMPAWALPGAGALLVVLLAAIWTTSSLWFFTTIGFPGV